MSDLYTSEVTVLSTAGITLRVFLHTLSPLVINFLVLLQKIFSLLQKSMILRSAIAEISAIALFVEALASSFRKSEEFWGLAAPGSSEDGGGANRKGLQVER